MLACIIPNRFAPDEVDCIIRIATEYPDQPPVIVLGGASATARSALRVRIGARALALGCGSHTNRASRPQAIEEEVNGHAEELRGASEDTAQQLLLHTLRRTQVLLHRALASTGDEAAEVRGRTRVPALAWSATAGEWSHR